MVKKDAGGLADCLTCERTIRSTGSKHRGDDANQEDPFQQKSRKHRAKTEIPLQQKISSLKIERKSTNNSTYQQASVVCLCINSTTKPKTGFSELLQIQVLPTTHGKSFRQ